MPDRKEINKRGYLKEDFRLFHLKDSRAQKVDYHYHAFDKLILLLGGKVTYVVEGVTYFLQPWDLLLVGHDLIHRPIIDPAEPYERVVIWLGREWLERRSDPGEALDTCFDTTRERGFHLLRFDAERRLHYMQRIQQLEEALRDRSFGAARMADTLCQQMLIDVNRDVLRSRTAQEERDSYRVDPKMEEVLRYILDHLGEELTVESLSKRFFISRYYLMHRFKAVTGYTVHQYISQKRLLRAGELIRAGPPDQVDALVYLAAAGVGLDVGELCKGDARGLQGGGDGVIGAVAADGPAAGDQQYPAAAEPAHQRAGVFLFSIAEGEEGGGVEGEVVHG